MPLRALRQGGSGVWRPGWWADPTAHLVFYAAAVVGVTQIHDPAMLAGLFLVALVAMGGEGLTLLLRALVAVALVNVTVSAGYIGAAIWQGEPWLTVVARLNARVLLLTIMTLWVARHVDWRGAAARWPALRLLLAIAEAQIRALQRLMAEFRLAWRSRTVRRPGLAERYRVSAQRLGALTDRALAQSEELTLGMRSRGGLDRSREPD